MLTDIPESSTVYKAFTLHFYVQGIFSMRAMGTL
jgi:hypothetical protein